MKFWVKVLLLWMVVISAAGILSKRDRFTFVFEGEELSHFVIDEEETKKEEADAQELKNTVQTQAAMRNYDGIYEGVGVLHIEDARRAVDENGMNLMWGTYDVSLKVNGSDSLTCRIICPGKQSFIREGTTEGVPADDLVTFSFTVTDAAEHIKLCVSEPERIESATIVKRGTTAIDRDLLAYFCVFGIMLTILLALGEGMVLPHAGIVLNSNRVQRQTLGVDS